MIVLELPEIQAEELRTLLESNGKAVEMIYEERFFGDATIVTLVIENTESIVAILAGAITLYDKIKVVVRKPNGEGVDLSKMSDEQIRTKLVI
jgi:hypothetical protein